jgi:hypothetical protein
MNIKVSLHSEGDCEAIIKCTKEQKEFLDMVAKKLKDDPDQFYAPSMNVEDLTSIERNS